MKILSSRNGVALVAVLTVLLVLTLLLPVMFRTSETATYTSATEISRQKAGYLARSGAEMAVATLKETLAIAKDDKNSQYAKLFDALKGEPRTADDITTYGIDTSGEYYSVQLKSVSLYVKKDTSGNVVDSKYISGTPAAGDISGYEPVGTATITISYNGEPEYYKIEKVDGKDTYTKITREEAFDSVPLYEEKDGRPAVSIDEIKKDCIAIYNDNYMVKSQATVNGQKATRTAVVMEAVDMYDEENPDDSFIAYTEQYWSQAPEFIQRIEGDYPDPYVWEEEKILGIPTGKEGYVKVDDKGYGYGGNQAFANPFKATAKKTIEAFGKGLDGVDLGGDDYYSKDVYIYSTIGNMHINVPEGKKTVTAVDHDKGTRGGNVNNQRLVLGAYPGINWRVFENTSSSYNPSLQAVNYNSYSSTVQRYNFLSFCATDTLQVSLPVELRVNPKRSNRGGVTGIGDGTAPNRTLFKLMNFQAKEIIFDERIDLFASLCDQEFTATSVGPSSDDAYRGGYLNLVAPSNTPYSYYNVDRQETVSAGIVYFNKPVYIWFQDINALGHDTSAFTVDEHANSGGETMFRTPSITDNTQFSVAYSNDRFKLKEHVGCCLKVYKIFEAGDVYYFNSEITSMVDGEEVNIGVNLVNWFLETQYITAQNNSGNIWTKILNLKKTLYTAYLQSMIDKYGNFVLDDMHFIGNMNDNPTLTPEGVEDKIYVVWDN